MLPAVTEAGWRPMVSAVRTHTVPTHMEAANKTPWSQRSWEDQRRLTEKSTVLMDGRRGYLHSGQGAGQSALTEI